jgi:hypothetical protein
MVELMLEAAPIVRVVHWKLSDTEPKELVPVTVQVVVPVGVVTVPLTTPPDSDKPLGIAGYHVTTRLLLPVILVFRSTPATTSPSMLIRSA